MFEMESLLDVVIWGFGMAIAPPAVGYAWRLVAGPKLPGRHEGRG